MSVLFQTLSHDLHTKSTGNAKGTQSKSRFETHHLVAASAEPLILSLLDKEETYGDAIIQEIKVRSDGKLNWTDGMLYPVLHRM